KAALDDVDVFDLNRFSRSGRLIDARQDTQRHRLGAEVEGVVGLVAVHDANELAALVRTGGPEIDTGGKPGHQELVVFELGNQSASYRLRIPPGPAVS